LSYFIRIAFYFCFCGVFGLKTFRFFITQYVTLLHIIPDISRLFPLNPVYSPALGILFDGFIKLGRFSDFLDLFVSEE